MGVHLSTGASDPPPGSLSASPSGIEEILRATVGDIEALRSRSVDLDALRREAERLRDDPFGNLERLIDSALHRRTEEYLIVTDVERDARRLRAFLRRHFLAYRALRARLLRDAFTRQELRSSGTGLLGRVTSVDVFRYIARTSGGAATVSLAGRAAVFILPGFDGAQSARASPEASSRGRLVVSEIGDLSNPDLLSFVVRLHARHEAAHSEDGMRHRAGLRNRYTAEPESDAAMTLFARRDSELLGTEVEAILLSVAKLRELAGESYFFCSHAIRRCLQVEPGLLVRMQDEEIARFADAIADSVVPPYRTLSKVEQALLEMWELTRSSSINYDDADPRRARVQALLLDPDVRAWLSQTLAALARFGICLEEQRERVLRYARLFYAGERPRV